MFRGGTVALRHEEPGEATASVARGAFPAQLFDCPSAGVLGPLFPDESFVENS